MIFSTYAYIVHGFIMVKFNYHNSALFKVRRRLQDFLGDRGYCRYRVGCIAQYITANESRKILCPG